MKRDYASKLFLQPLSAPFFLVPDRRYAPGPCPFHFLNALLNAASLSYSTREAISAVASLPSWIISMALCIRQRARYRSGGSPTSFANRFANAERDIPERIANCPTVQGLCGVRWILAIASPICGSLAAANQFGCSPGTVFAYARTA